MSEISKLCPCSCLAFSLHCGLCSCLGVLPLQPTPTRGQDRPQRGRERGKVPGRVTPNTSLGLSSRVSQASVLASLPLAPTCPSTPLRKGPEDKQVWVFSSPALHATARLHASRTHYYSPDSFSPSGGNLSEKKKSEWG